MCTNTPNWVFVPVTELPDINVGIWSVTALVTVLTSDIPAIFLRQNKCNVWFCATDEKKKKKKIKIHDWTYIIGQEYKT